MFVDSSALFAILAGEPEQAEFSTRIEKSKLRFTSGLVRLETVMALSRFYPGEVERCAAAVDQLIQRFDLEEVPITGEVARLAVEAFQKFGRGSGHPAKLNLSDCMTYAAARHYRLALLCKGDAFPHTDITLVKRQA